MNRKCCLQWSLSCSFSCSFLQCLKFIFISSFLFLASSFPSSFCPHPPNLFSYLGSRFHSLTLFPGWATQNFSSSASVGSSSLARHHCSCQGSGVRLSGIKAQACLLHGLLTCPCSVSFQVQVPLLPFLPLAKEESPFISWCCNQTARKAQSSNNAKWASVWMQQWTPFELWSRQWHCLRSRLYDCVNTFILWQSNDHSQFLFCINV